MSGIIAQNSGRHTGLVKASSGGGVWNLIKTYTASSDSTLSFVEGTDGVDFTAYDEFVFKFNNMHPETDSVGFQFNFSTDTGSNYNVTKTTTFFLTYHREDDLGTGFEYVPSLDLAQSTSYQRIVDDVGNDNDQCFSGTLHLFSPSDTTFVKHFIYTGNEIVKNDISRQCFVAGYGNTTSAVDAIQFQFTSGNIDAGTISLYGIS
jgi:hypothetical protein